jgi:hypothetical protein
LLRFYIFRRNPLYDSGNTALYLVCRKGGWDGTSNPPEFYSHIHQL